MCLSSVFCPTTSKIPFCLRVFCCLLLWFGHTIEFELPHFSWLAYLIGFTWRTRMNPSRIFGATKYHGNPTLIVWLHREGEDVSTEDTLWMQSLKNRSSKCSCLLITISNYLYVWCCCLVTQLCPTLCDPVDWSPPGSSVHWIPQARILEWVIISFPRGPSWPRNWTMSPKFSRQIHYQWATWEA